MKKPIIFCFILLLFASLCYGEAGDLELSAGLNVTTDVNVGDNVKIGLLNASSFPSVNLYISEGDSPSGSVKELFRLERFGDDDDGQSGIGLSQTFYLENQSGAIQLAGAFIWEFPTVSAGDDAGRFTLRVKSSEGDNKDLMRTDIDGLNIQFLDSSTLNYLNFLPQVTGGDLNLLIDMDGDNREIKWTGGAAAGADLEIEALSKINQDTTTDANVNHNDLTLAGTLDVTGVTTLSDTLNVTGVTTITGVGGNGLIGYDLKIGDTTTPDYGLLLAGDSVFGRVPYNAMSMDLDGSVIIRNLTAPATSNIEFAFLESGGTSIRFALAKSAVGNATLNPRSLLVVGPAVWNDEIVTVGYWQTNNSIFDNLACDTVGSGADLGVQGSIEVEGFIYVDEIRESTTAAGITFAHDISTTGSITGGSLITGGTVTATGVITGAGFKSPGFTGAGGLVFTDNIPGDWEIDDGTSALNVTGASSINQGVKTTDSPTFVKVNLTDEVNALQIDGTTQFATKSSTYVSGSGNLYIGPGTGVAATTASRNVLIGDNAGGKITTSDDNVCVGAEAGADLSTGTGANFFMGSNAGWRTTSGIGNFALGAAALLSNLTGSQNICIGTESGFSLTSFNNTLVGYRTGYLGAGIAHNTGIGYQALRSNITGSYNTAIGFEALKGVEGVSAFSNNTAIGRDSGFGLTSGSDNLFLGHKSGMNQTTNSDLLIIDNQDRGSAASEITDSLIYGVFNATPASQTLRLNAATTITGLHVAITTKTNTNYTLTATDDTVLFDTGATTRIATLPAASTVTGKIYHIKKIDAGSGLVTIDGNASETIDGDLTPDITAQYESVTIASDGSNWHIL